MEMLRAWIARVMASLPRVDSTTVPAAVWRVLLPHERHRITIRQHPAVLVGPLVLVVGWFIGAIIASQFLPGKTNDPPALIIWSAWLVIVLRFGIQIYGWSESYLVFSDLHLFAVSGALVRSVQAVPLTTLSDVSFSKSRVGRIFDYGKFTLEVGGADRVIVPIDYVPDPEEILVEIRAILFAEASVDAAIGAEEGEQN